VSGLSRFRENRNRRFIRSEISLGERGVRTWPERFPAAGSGRQNGSEVVMRRTQR